MTKASDTPTPWEANYRARRLFKLLSQGSMTTLELINEGFIHPARQIWELRHWYGKQIKTKRTRANVARYVLEKPREANYA